MKVLEYNVRFGDPECQPLLMRLQSDIVDILEAVADGELDRIEPPQWDPRPACCVVIASQGYPGSYKTGYEIRGLEDADCVENVKVFHAGTSLGQFDKDRIVTSGGRVLGVTALGNTVAEAKTSAYAAVECIAWNGSWCRSDISDKAHTKPTINDGLHPPELPIEDV
jgi:phosphoribosylamine--glycine ligase